MCRILAFLFVLLLPGFAAAQTISINFCSQVSGVYSPVAQRAPGGTTAVVTCTGSYTGTAPSTVYLQAVDSIINSTVIVSWVLGGSQTISGGNWSATVTLPQRNGVELVQAGENSSSPTIISSLTTKVIGTGMVVGPIFGDSETGMKSSKFGAGTPGSTQYVYGYCVNATEQSTNCASGWGDLTLGNTSSYQRAIGASLQPVEQVPIALLFVGRDSTLIVNTPCFNGQWPCTANSPWTVYLTSLSGAGINDAEAGILSIGGGDSRNNSPMSVATEIANQQIIYTNVLASFSAGRTVAQYPLFLSSISPETSQGTNFNQGFTNMRASMQLAPASNSSTYNLQFASTFIDCPPDTDGTHPQYTCYIHMGYRDGQSILKYQNLVSVGGSGPIPVSATYSGSQITVTVTLNGSTALTDNTGSTTNCAPAGFAETDSSGANPIVSCSFIQPNKIVLQMTNPVLAPVTIVNQQGPNAVNPMFCTWTTGNVAVCPNSIYGNATPTGDTLGLPLLPTTSAITATAATAGIQSGHRI